MVPLPANWVPIRLRSLSAFAFNVFVKFSLMYFPSSFSYKTDPANRSTSFTELHILRMHHLYICVYCSKFKKYFLRKTKITSIWSTEKIIYIQLEIIFGYLWYKINNAWCMDVQISMFNNVRCTFWIVIVVIFISGIHLILSRRGYDTVSS